MSITYKELARIVGVSRATVDRVIHNRGHVSPELERRIREVAKEHGFQPNHIGRALAMAKNPVKIGVLIHLTRIPFFKRVLEGIDVARSEIAKLGGELVVYEQESFDPQAQIEALDALVAEGVQGIALSPAHDDGLRKRLNRLVHEQNIPVVTFNTYIEGTDSLCYVGVDNAKVGRVGAYLMDLLLARQGGKVLIISGYLTHQTNYQRVDGFASECGLYHSGIDVVGLEMNYDDEQRAYDITMQAFETHPDLAGIFMVSSGQPGCCQAVEDAGKAGDIKLVIVDSLPDTDEYLRRGVVQFIVDQDAYTQGTLPPEILFNYLFSNKKPERNILSQIGIKARHTV